MRFLVDENAGVIVARWLRDRCLAPKAAEYSLKQQSI
jgi:hypothetical protein